MLADGIPIDDDVAAWQRSIGLVPQDVYLIDDTLRANIALGEPEEVIDEDRLGRGDPDGPARRSCGRCRDGLSTFVGERGTG